MPNVFVSVVNYKVEYVLRDVNGGIIPNVSVVVYDSETGNEVDLREGPFTYSGIMESNTFPGSRVLFYLPAGVYDITFTDVSSGDSLVLKHYFLGNVNSLKNGTPGDLYVWQRHIVDDLGRPVSGMNVTVKKYVDYEDTSVAEFYPNGDYGQKVSSYEFDDYVYLEVESGLYEITVSATSGSLIQVFEHVALGYTPPADLMGE